MKRYYCIYAQNGRAWVNFFRTKKEFRDWSKGEGSQITRFEFGASHWLTCLDLTQFAEKARVA